MSTLVTTALRHNASASNNMVLDSSGRVGIGTATPNFSLDVLGTGTSTSHRGNVNALIRSNGSGFNSTLRLSDSISNSTDLSLLGGTTQMSVNGIAGLAFNDSGNLQFNSGYGSVATAFGCRAWVNFNGTGTIAIRGSGNVSSITDNGVGDYTLNFTNAFPDTIYTTVFGGWNNGSGNGGWNAEFAGAGGAYGTGKTTSALRVAGYNSSTGANQDQDGFYVAIFR